jgi:TrmH family RNA methyltransferase
MIVSRQNAKLKTIRRLARCKEDVALLEGPHLVLEAISAGVPLEALLMSPSLAERPEGRRIRDGARCTVDEVDPGLLAELMDADSPQGVLAVATLRRPGVDALPRREDGVYLYLDGVQDPGNVGAIARVAEAAGATALAFGAGTAHPNHPRALRASAGSLLRVPVAVDADPRALAGHLAPLSPRWVSLVAHGGRELYDEPLVGTDGTNGRDGALVLALGSEGAGLTDSARDLADVELRIPLAPPVESLNVATSAAVVLFELRRRASAGEHRQPARAAR